MIRVAIVDDHPALRAGLQTVLAAEPGLHVAGTATNGEGVLPLLRRAAPDVVLLDYHLPDGDGLLLCRQIKHLLPPPRVLVYSAYADERLTIAAAVAGADGVMNKGAPARELFDGIRRVARGERVLGQLPSRELDLAMREVDPQDAAIVAMLVHGATASEIDRALGVSAQALDDRISRIVAQLRVETPAART